MRRTISGAGQQNPAVVLLLPVLDFGGIESRAVIQVAGMIAHGDRVRVCCFERSGHAAAAIRNLGVPVDVLGTRPSVRNPHALWRLLRYLRSFEVDVLHARTGAMTVHGLLAAWLARVPVRITEEVGIPERGRVGRRVFPWLYRLATCVIGVSDAVADYLVAEDGVPADKVRRVHNAIDGRFFVEREHIDSGDVRVLSVGRLARVKGHADLLDAMAPLLSSGAAVSLRVVGDGPERETLEALSRELGIAERVEFLGYRSDLPELLAESDVFVLPSRMEGFGLAVVEAMASRVPVVATRVGGIPEVVPGWASDWLVEPGDSAALAASIERACTLDPAQRRVLGERLRAHAQEHFGPDRYVTELRALYRELLDATRAR